MKASLEDRSQCLLLLLLAAYISSAKAWPWGGESHPKVDIPALLDLPHYHGFEPTPGILDATLTELATLESQPLCHRTAALFLMDDCHLLNGKNEATMLMDTGPQIRDFVDSYAASLAICDLERGSFVIPESCSKFREEELAKAASTADANGGGGPKMALTTTEIGACLSGLSKSDSAWNTWVSYRHKALRFCEVARIDNEKAHTLAVHKRLVHVLSNLTSGLEAAISARMHMLDSKLASMEKMEARFDNIWHQLQKIETAVSTRLSNDIKASSEMLASTLGQAATLDRYISSLGEKARLQTDELSEQGQMALARISSQADEGLAKLELALASSLQSAVQLSHQVDISSQRMERIEMRQESLQERAYTKPQQRHRTNIRDYSLSRNRGAFSLVATHLSHGSWGTKFGFTLAVCCVSRDHAGAWLVRAAAVCRAQSGARHIGRGLWCGDLGA
ncbi:hypothetical protein HOO65_021089 [Ceratocystis lukuohia]|uniref:Nuclear fusion protein KAR5 n=1 Tax=Ceratocystis lukuohia TaxID=2019550 RepID=A0ABR4MQH7_9PEZI